MARTVRSLTHHTDVPDAGPALSVVSVAGPKRRRPSWVALGVVLVGLAALLGAWVFTTTSHRLSIVVASHDIAPGEVVTAADLRVVEMGQTGGVRAIQSSQQDLIIGQAARGPIPEGTILNTGLFSQRSDVVPAGQVVVGAELDPGAVPTSALQAGDHVELLGVVKATSTDASGTAQTALSLGSGTVWSVERATATSTSSKLWVSLLIPEDAQAAVAQSAADGLLRFSLVGGGS
ncbi:MAG: hypothetical protein JWL72_1412 [Ilumatobacteraceae bacterium]|nr:hypothetical protein [Ilumatobacteraceae bacterium]